MVINVIVFWFLFLFVDKAHVDSIFLLHFLLHYSRLIPSNTKPFKRDILTDYSLLISVSQLLSYSFFLF